MKKLKLFMVALTITAVVSCEKDDTVRPVSVAHEDNRMMREIHNMMDRMSTMDNSSDPDTHFAILMKMHHEGAINMANIVVAEGDNGKMKEIADKMVRKQTRQIEELNAFLATHTPHAPNKDFNTKVEESLERMHANADLQLLNGDLDHDFAVLMIFHHQSAIEMATLVIIYGHEPKVKSMAEIMIKDQELEIKELQNWLRQQ